MVGVAIYYEKEGLQLKDQVVFSAFLYKIFLIDDHYIRQEYLPNSDFYKDLDLTI